VVILDFWATWCGPCVPGLKHLNELAQKVQGVRIYAVNLMESSEQIEQFMQRHSLKLPALLDTEGQVAEQYRVEPIPHTVVIGRDGKIVDVVVGFDPAVAPARLDAAIAKAKGEGQ
jgi:thiol-disulfide isomerase/thioredoxin